jgi:hypothetical protein
LFFAWKKKNGFDRESCCVQPKARELIGCGGVRSLLFFYYLNNKDKDVE